MPQHRNLKVNGSPFKHASPMKNVHLSSQQKSKFLSPNHRIAGAINPHKNESEDDARFSSNTTVRYRTHTSNGSRIDSNFKLNQNSLKKPAKAKQVKIMNSNRKEKDMIMMHPSPNLLSNCPDHTGPSISQIGIGPTTFAQKLSRAQQNSNLSPHLFDTGKDSPPFPFPTLNVKISRDN